MENRKKQAKKWCCIAIVCMLISMIGASMIQSNGGKRYCQRNKMGNYAGL